MTQEILTPEKVESIFMDCLFKDWEDKSNYTKVEGVTMTIGFHPGRLESHKDEIVAMLSELPDGFHQKTGGGQAFLNACEDKHGNQWTGLHRTMEQLFILGIGIGRVQPCAPREFWGTMPGGMPYYVVLAEKENT